MRDKGVVLNLIPQRSLHFRRAGMSKIRTCLVFAISVGFLSLPALATRTHRTVASGRTRSAHKAIPKSHKMHGQQAIDSARVTQIQEPWFRRTTYRRAQRKMGRRHRSGHAEVSVRSRLANQADARFPGPQKAGTWSRLFHGNQCQRCGFFPTAPHKYDSRRAGEWFCAGIRCESLREIEVSGAPWPDPTQPSPKQKVRSKQGGPFVV